MALQDQGPLLAKVIAGGRVLYGLGAMVAPKAMMGMKGDAAAPGPLVWMVRTFGVRDVVLGAGAFKSLNDGDTSAKLWVQMGALADTLDVGNALVFRNELDRQGKAAAIGIAVPAAVAGWWSSRSL